MGGAFWTSKQFKKKKYEWITILSSFNFYYLFIIFFNCNSWLEKPRLIHLKIYIRATEKKFRKGKLWTEVKHIINSLYSVHVHYIYSINYFCVNTIPFYLTILPGLEYLEKEFPLLDYIYECNIIDDNLPYIYSPKVLWS